MFRADWGNARSCAIISSHIPKVATAPWRHRAARSAARSREGSGRKKVAFRESEAFRGTIHEDQTS